VLAGVAAGLVLYGSYRLGTWKQEMDVEARIDRFAGLIARHARAQSLPPELVRAVIRCESKGDVYARSRTNARGLMQITALTQEELLRLKKIRQAGNLEDPDFNIRLGTLYLRLMMDKFGQDELLAVAAYNAGPTRLADLRAAHAELSSQELVDQFAPAETRNYCRNVLEWRRRYQPPSSAPPTSAPRS
jgi:soluble lytic murein transglycosylase